MNHSHLDQTLAGRLEEIRGQGLLRQLRRVDSPQGVRIRMEDQTLLNFSSNDYLGLANHPVLKEVAVRAVEQYGAGSGAARLVCGSLAPHHELEELLAAWKGTEAALSFSTGYATAVGAIAALVDKSDIVVIDKLVHASIVDAARLSGAKLRVFAHNDLGDLEAILKWAGALPARAGTEKKRPNVLVVTESIFSMDGDQAPLREIVALKEKYGAWLMVDEAHATGVFGENRRGLAEELGLNHRIDVQMGTLGKALGTAGGYICGSRVLIDFLVNRARSFIFSTAPMPVTAATAAAAIRLIQSPEGTTRRRQLWDRIKQLQSLLAPAKSATRHPRPPVHGPIQPFMIGEESHAVAAAGLLRQKNIFVPAIRYPTVARGEARLRITVTADHSLEDLQTLTAALDQIPLSPPAT